jgi:hypothetical protein
MISALFFTENAAARLGSQPIHFFGQLGQHEVGSAEIRLSREQAAQLADSSPFFGDPHGLPARSVSAPRETKRDRNLKACKG